MVKMSSEKVIATIKLIFTFELEPNDGRVSELKFFVYSFFLLFLVSIPFFIFFYDSFNLNANLLSISNLILGLNPYRHGSFLVAGYMMFPYYLFLNFSYTFTGHNLEVTIVLVKILATIITFFSAVLIYKIVVIKNRQAARTLFLSFLFNPFIFFVNDIWVQPEFLPIFFLLFALYIFKRNQSNIQWKHSVIIMLFLTIAGWLYYFPFLLIPTLLVYSKNLRQFYRMLSSMFLVNLPSFFIVYYFHLNISPVSAVTSSSIIPTVYSIFSIMNLSSHCLAELGKISLIIMILSAFLFPIIGKLRGEQILLVLLIVLSIIFIFQINELNADSYVISIPFILLSSVEVIKKLTYSKILLLQTFLISQFSIVQLYNGPNGLAAGIFYWLYPYYHYNIILARDVPQIFLIHSILLIVFIISLLVVILYFVMCKRNSKVTDSNINKIENGGPLVFSSPVINASIEKPKRTVLLVVFLTIAIVSVNFYTYQIPNNNAVKSSNDFPYELFMPSFSNNYSTYVQQSPSLYSYYSANNTLFFWPQSQGIGLSRNITSQDVNILGTFFIKGSAQQVTSPLVIIKSNNLLGGVSSGILIENNSTQLRPIYISNITSDILPSNYYFGSDLLHDTPIRAYSYSNTSYAEYKFNYTLVYGKSILYGAYITRPSKNQDILWRMQIDNITYEAFVYGSSLISGYYFNSTWHLYSVTTVKLREWFVLGIAFNKNGTITSLANEHQLTFPRLVDLRGAIELNTGMFGNSTRYKAFSFSGIETAMFLIPSVDQNIHFLTYIEDQKTNTIFVDKITNLSNINIAFRKLTQGTVTLVIGNANVTLRENTSYITFGSISPSKLMIGYNFYSIIIKGRSTGPNYLVLVEEDSLIYPALVLLFACMENWRKRQ